MERGTQYELARIRWNTRRTWTMPRFRRWRSAGTFYVPTIDHNRYYLDNWQKIWLCERFQEKTKAFIERNLETARKAFKAGVKFAMGLGRDLHDVRREYSRAGLVCESRNDAGAGAFERNDECS